MIENLEIKDTFFDLSAQIFSILRTKNLLSQQKLIIGIAGESGSGKSVTALCLVNYLEKKGYIPCALNMDDYFNLPANDNHLNRLKDIDANVGPQEVNLRLLDQHLIAFRNDENIEGPSSDFGANRLITKELNFKGKQILIVEGTYVFGLENLDLGIFLQINFKQSLINRLKRGREQFDAFVEKVLEIEHKIISKYALKADLIIDEEYNLKEINTNKYEQTV
jgi:uridine kinase